ncbi:prolyl 3-hydroxylase OGFOD1-like [Halichondria panicea]|uniref:prolyl 3-hydroxylase OGFOD1-like n=1 Tax=Halichondria panicea TaxID=6063 RepID=UPI00312BC4FA
MRMSIMLLFVASKPRGHTFWLSKIKKMKRASTFQSSDRSAPPAKKQLLEQTHPKVVYSINSDYRSANFQEKLSSTWRENGYFNDLATGAQLLCRPFQCCVLPKFIKTPVAMETSREGLLEGLTRELLRLKFYEKNNDLYQFHQSNDLKKFTDYRCISALRCLLREQCLPWLRQVTGLQLTDTIDITCSKYEYTDVLLCHDDELEGRRIAFILYLVPEWSKEDGGSLDLFTVDGKGQPSSICQSLIPDSNNFIFFDVNAVSFHQVSEVLSTKTRLSVSGWFHGPPPVRAPPYKDIARPLHPPLPMGLEVLSDWINPVYLDIGVYEQIQGQFEEESQVELPDFLLDNKYQQICEDMKECKVTVVGPANKRRVHRLSPEDALGQLLRVLTSQPFCLLLSHLTGLDLAENVIRDSADSAVVDDEGLSASPTSRDGSVGPSMLEVNKINGEQSFENDEDGGVKDVGEPSVKCTTTNSVQSENLVQNAVALCHCDVYRWCHGDYTLAGDEGTGRFVLDAQLHCCSDDWSPDYGGVVSYIAKDADEELLSIVPRPNALSLVYKEPDTLSFTKYVNHRASEGVWLNTIQATYVENTDSNS